jgi:hypothetical protein
MVLADVTFAPLVAQLQPRLVVLHGAAPPALEGALCFISMRVLRLDPQGGSLGALLYGADVAWADLLWLDAPEALLDWEPAAGLIAWERQGPVPVAVQEHLQSAGYHLAEAGLIHLARRAVSAPRLGDIPALRALAARLPEGEALPLLRLIAPWDGSARQALVAALTAQGDWAGALYLAAGRCPADQAAHAALEGFNRRVAAGDLTGAERLASALAAFSPANKAVLEAALACNRHLGHGARAQRFARDLLALDPGHAGAHLVRLEQSLAEGDRAAELASRIGLALSPPEALHPLRRLHEAHRAISLHLLKPLDAVGRDSVQALVAVARGVEPMQLPEGEARHWARHYRHLAEAADAALLGRSAAPISVKALHRAEGRPLSWAGLRRQARGAKLAFVVAADAAYLRLYGRAYLTSILRHADLPVVILVHVIGAARNLPELIRLMDLPDPRIFYSADDFAPGAVTTQCHDSDGPRALPVAHFQCTRFAMARRVMMELRLPVLVSDIDAVLQRGVAELLARFAGCDVVLNRNEASEAFGSHITANLLLAWPSGPGLDFMAGLQGYLEAALAGPHVTRWIDQCGLQACWNASTARFGWFDTSADINNVMYPHWMPNPFLFLSLFHGFDMASLPAAA